jgi:hypothetical protein
MRALKVLVVVMGVLLLAGVAVVIVTIMTRLAQHPAATAPAAAMEGRPVPFGTTTLALPAGARVIEMQSAGRRLALHLRHADGSEALLILDPDTGTEIGTIELKPQN